MSLKFSGTKSQITSITGNNIIDCNTLVEGDLNIIGASLNSCSKNCEITDLNGQQLRIDNFNKSILNIDNFGKTSLSINTTQPKSIDCKKIKVSEISKTTPVFQLPAGCWLGDHSRPSNRTDTKDCNVTGIEDYRFYLIMLEIDLQGSSTNRYYAFYPLPNEEHGVCISLSNSYVYSKDVGTKHCDVFLFYQRNSAGNYNFRCSHMPHKSDNSLKQSQPADYFVCQEADNFYYFIMWKTPVRLKIT